MLDIIFSRIHRGEQVTVESIGTVKQLADNLTKARRHERCSELRTKLGVIDVQNVRKA